MRKKPVIGIYDCISKEIELNTFHGEEGEKYSFRCPDVSCGRPVQVGYPICPFCRQRLKWKYPFKKVEVD